MGIDFYQSSFCVGPIQVRPALALAPLHEVTDRAFRTFMREMGGLGMTVSEMVSSEALIRNASKAEKMLEGDGGRPFAIQIVGARPDVMAEAAIIALGAGADVIDINIGCPASNVTGGLAGSALLRDIRLAESIAVAVVKSAKAPVTVKMRVGWDDSQKGRGEYLDFLRMFDAIGISAVTIHPRTRAQQYSGAADWACIARAVECGFGYPIIGNGDVLNAADANRMVAETGCQGVMIGRGAMYNPFIFKQIADKTLAVEPKMRIEAAISFFEILMRLNGERDALHKIKKFSGYFTKGIPGAASLRQRLNSIHLAADILVELKKLAATI
ncbi:MAG: tRNA-dihydrouridine synthase [Holophagales bacterium]|jgi:nifR3 family TIM-barrel protein|nr:tRNA-dihydrouridine synthase [Holophagales bacterium]